MIGDTLGQVSWVLMYRFFLNRDDGRDFCNQRRQRYLLLNLLNFRLNLLLPFCFDFSDKLRWRRRRQRNGHNFWLSSRDKCVIVQGNLILAAEIVGNWLQPKRKISSEYEFIIILDETLMYCLGVYCELIEHGVGGEEFDIIVIGDLFSELLEDGLAKGVDGLGYFNLDDDLLFMVDEH